MAVYRSESVTRILPLVPILLWLLWSNPDASGVATTGALAAPQWLSVLWMVGGLLAIVAFVTLWARLLLRSHRHSFAPVPTRGFNYAVLLARLLGMGWYGFALYKLGYGPLIDQLLQPIDALGIRLPSLIATTAPALITWFGLLWAAYPIDRATREQNLLVEIDSGLTPRAPPTLAQSLSTNFRMQVLFILAPVFAVWTLRDLVAIAFKVLQLPLSDRVEGMVFVASSLIVFIASPELLVRVLRARPLAPSPLRTRLETLAQRLNLRYRDVLVWHTSYGIGNAAVMGLIPRFRYILLTDLLLETLDDAQIEAVFAHEAGHVKHRHLLWYVTFWMMAILSLDGPGNAVQNVLQTTLRLDPAVAAASIYAAVIGGALILFGALSRLFERQADVFAARSIQSIQMSNEEMSRRAPMATPVGSIGAESFVSALSRVAEISRRPLTRRARARTLFAGMVARLVDVTVNFTHPSIPERIDHLRGLAMTPALTARFDRKVVLVMTGMLFILMALSTWVLIAQFS